MVQDYSDIQISHFVEMQQKVPVSLLESLWKEALLAIVQTSTCKLNSVMLMMKFLNYWTLYWIDRNAVHNYLSVRL